MRSPIAGAGSPESCDSLKRASIRKKRYNWNGFASKAVPFGISADT
jgi:hypothetical protein